MRRRHAERISVEDEGAIDLGDLDLRGVAREHIAVAALSARHPAACRGALEDPLAAIRKDALLARELVQHQHPALAVAARERAEHPERIGELLAGHAMALGLGGPHG